MDDKRELPDDCYPPIIDDLELPIVYVKFTGPAVDALENRKEPGCLVEPSEAEFYANWLGIKDDLMRSLNALVNNIDAPLDSAIAKLGRE